MQAAVYETADEISRQYPKAPIAGFRYFCQYETLYKLKPPQQADGAFIFVFIIASPVSIPQLQLRELKQHIQSLNVQR
ncbi:unnamed protein product [Phytophthora fragariaefolia]|uniref:Unnamed protein product n=1 Tax=Phytophthora fragariaefolia TaxID=1490495 RepID=A0A9W6XWN6_9STRA|nr:unnamed protein product [Phytophthora fragariaefolia]